MDRNQKASDKALADPELTIRDVFVAGMIGGVSLVEVSLMHGAMEVKDD